MKISLVVASLVIGSITLVGESVYDGTGSLINADETRIWGGNKDEADMQVHKGKNSTVTFQVLRNETKCTHVNIHTNVNMGQDVIIRIKQWSNNKSIEKAYKTRLPVYSYKVKDGVSIQLDDSYAWSTISVTSTKPVNQQTAIYAYCRSPIDTLNLDGLQNYNNSMLLLENNHYHLGNGSVISAITKKNGQGEYGTTQDLAVTSSTLDAESSFQVMSDKNRCKEITLSNVSGDHLSPSTVENILVKGWSSAKWTQSSCDKLPCTLNTYFTSKGNPTYMLINVKTKAGQNGRLYAKCGTQKNVKFTLNEKDSKPKNLHSCQFEDLNHDWSDKYITALCSAGILEGYGSSNYKNFGPNNHTLWQELTKVVNLADNFYKTKKIRESYPSEPWAKAYLDIASKQGYRYNGAIEVKRGLAFQYVVDVFWHKKLSEDGATTFLQNKRVISKRDINNYLTRAEMSKVVLNSARFAGDEEGIERKLPYTNHVDTKLEESIEKDKNMPKSQFKEIKKSDTPSELKKKIETNKKSAVQNNTTTKNTKKTETDNTQLTKDILNLKGKLKNKSAEEIEAELKNDGKTKNAINDTKFEEGKSYIGTVKSTGETVILPPANAKGEVAVEVIEEKDGKKNKKVINGEKPTLDRVIDFKDKVDQEDIVEKDQSEE